MSKTFTGTVNFSFKITLPDEDISALVNAIDTGEPDTDTMAFVKYLRGLGTVDEKVAATIAQTIKRLLKEDVMDWFGTELTHSPIQVKVEAKKRA